MKSGWRPIEYVVWGCIGVTVVGIALAFILSRSYLTPETPPVYGTVPSFSLTNQFAEEVSLSKLSGKIWLGNIIFSRCAGPCPKLSRQMEALDQRLSDVPSLHLVSLTADPAFDDSSVLSKYGKRFNARDGRWDFLTGSKADLYRLAADGLKLAVMEKEESERENVNDMFIHSTVITLVDSKGQLRGFFEGLEPDATEKIVNAVRALLKERG